MARGCWDIAATCWLTRGGFNGRRAWCSPRRWRRPPRRRVEVKRLGLSVIVMEGTAAATLRRAAGHIRGTAMPGEPGNVGISGHRDTFFYPLRNVRASDVVTVTTREGEFRYRVVSVTVVQPDDTGVLAGDETQVLTLVTCYPFAFIGSAPERFIVRAEREI